MVLLCLLQMKFVKIHWYHVCTNCIHPLFNSFIPQRQRREKSASAPLIGKHTFVKWFTSVSIIKVTGIVLNTIHLYEAAM